MFSFGRDVLCQWVTEDEVAEIVSAVYPWNGNADWAEHRLVRESADAGMPVDADRTAREHDASGR